MAIREIRVTTRMSGYGVRSSLAGTLYGGEALAHKFIVTDADGGSFSGTVSAKFIRMADDVTVPLTGAIENGAATVTLSANCYYKPGRFVLTIFVTFGGSTTEVYSCSGNVALTDGETTIDPSGEIALDVSALIAEIEEAQAAIPADYSALSTDVSGGHKDYFGVTRDSLADNVNLGANVDLFPVARNIENFAHMPLRYGTYKQFASFTSTASGGYRFSMHPAKREGFLSRVYIKSPAARTVKVLICAFNGGSTIAQTDAITVRSYFDLAVTSAQTEYVYGVDFFNPVYVPQNGIIGIYSSSGALYYLSNAGTGVEYSSAALALDSLYSGKSSLVGTRLGYDISLGMEVMSIYGKPCVDISTDVNCNLENMKTSFIVSLDTLSGAYIDCMVKLNGTTTQRIRVDFAGKQIIIFKSDNSTVSQTTSLSFNPSVGTLYSILLDRVDGNSISLTVTDMYDSSNTTTATIDEIFKDSKIGLGNNGVPAHAESGVTVISMRRISPVGRDIDLLILGDSYVEGYSIVASEAARNQRWAYLVREELGANNVVICGLGGTKADDGERWMNDFLLETYRPKYVYLGFGMNDYTLNDPYEHVWLPSIQGMIKACESIGAIPILSTIPPVNYTFPAQTYGPAHTAINAWIRSSGYLYIDIAKLLSANHDGVTADDTFFLPDKIHPTLASHKMIADMFLAEYGE